MAPDPLNRFQTAFVVELPEFTPTDVKMIAAGFFFKGFESY